MSKADETGDGEAAETDEGRPNPSVDQIRPFTSAADFAGVQAAMKSLADQAAPLSSAADLAGVQAAMKSLADQAAPLSRAANFAGVQRTLKAIAEQTEGFGALDRMAEISPILETLRSYSGNLSAARALGYRPLKEAAQKPSFVYSREMTSHASYFEQWEMEVDSFDEFLTAVNRLCRMHPGFTFLWRGQADADWPLQSSLFRAIWNAKGVQSPGHSRRTAEPFPTEDDMVRAEADILAFVREYWRFEDLGALSTFARLQHFGAPTRLLDVSRNPLIAAWFATAKEEETEERDCRIFALATGTLPGSELQKATQDTSSRVDSADAASPMPFWHTLHNDKLRAEYEWGTGRVRRFWIPPHYESRIAAQNAGFILDGVPLASPDLDRQFHKRGTETPWTYGDRLASASITTRFSRPNQPVGRRIATALPPSFTFRISARAKQEIRKSLSDHFSYNFASIYPDIQGAAMAMGGRLREIFSDS